MPTFQILANQSDMEKFRIWLDGMETRMARSEILPIMLRHLQPLVSAEKGILSSHSISGALEGSLMARAGRGDYEGKISVFSKATATTKLLQSTWGSRRGRAQQQKWAGGLTGKKGRSRVFYDIFVHQGHEVVAHGKATGKYTKPIPFAAQAAESLGDAESEAAANEILKHIVEG
jgi:hypothetical protein